MNHRKAAARDLDRRALKRAMRASVSAAVIGGGGAAATGVAGADAGSGRPCNASRHMCSATRNSPCDHAENSGVGLLTYTMFGCSDQLPFQ